MKNIKTISLKKLVEISTEMARENVRGRLLLGRGKILGYLCWTNQRLAGMNADESAEAAFKVLVKNPRHYEYEPGFLHLFCK